MQNTQIVACRIKVLCKEKNISVAQLLRDCNIAKSLIYDLERRGWWPSADRIVRVADYLGCSTDYLLGRTENPKVNE